MNPGVARPPPRDWSREWKVLGKCLGITGKHRARSIMVHIRTTNGMKLVVPNVKASNSSRTRSLLTRPRVPQTGTCSFSWEVNYNPLREPKSLLVAKCTGAQCNRCDAIYYTHNVLVLKANCPGVWEWKQEKHVIAYVQRGIWTSLLYKNTFLFWWHYIFLHYTIGKTEENTDGG